jgi:hypothetical protein
MTYRELAQQILELDSKWLDADVSIYLAGTDEYYGGYPIVFRFCDGTHNDVLDDGHPYLEVLEE